MYVECMNSTQHNPTQFNSIQFSSITIGNRGVKASLFVAPLLSMVDTRSQKCKWLRYVSRELFSVLVLQGSCTILHLALVLARRELERVYVTLGTSR
jgi:hypothetical protein